MWTLTCSKPEEMRAWAAALGRVAPRCSVVALVGDLGAGKTTFAQGVAAGMDIAAPVLSPTFVLIAEYPGDRPLLHADVYRLGAAELAGTGLEEALEGWPGVALVEWADRFPGLLPPDHLQVALAIREDGREIEVTAMGPRSAELLEAWRAGCALEP